MYAMYAWPYNHYKTVYKHMKLETAKSCVLYEDDC